MGMRRNAEIEAFQSNVGIKPAEGSSLKALEDIQAAAFDIIKTVELHKSGICDGDGHWGGDVMGCLLQQIKWAHRHYMEESVAHLRNVDIAEDARGNLHLVPL